MKKTVTAAAAAEAKEEATIASSLFHFALNVALSLKPRCYFY